MDPVIERILTVAIAGAIVGGVVGGLRLDVLGRSSVPSRQAPPLLDALAMALLGAVAGALIGAMAALAIDKRLGGSLACLGAAIGGLLSGLFRWHHLQNLRLRRQCRPQSGRKRIICKVRRVKSD